MHGNPPAFYPMTEAVYVSPISFTCTYLGANTLTLAGLPFVPTNAQFAELRVATVGGATNVYPSVSYNFSYNSGTGVLTIAGANLLASDLAYRLTIVGNPRAYNAAADYYRYAEIDPLDQHDSQISLIDAVNTAADVNLPSDNGLALSPGQHNFVLTGKLINDVVMTVTVYGTADNDPVAANNDWIQLYGYRRDTGVFVNTVVNPGTTTTFAWEFRDCPYAFVRVRLVVGDASNTAIIKMVTTAI